MTRRPMSASQRHERRVRSRFEGDTREHRMTIIRDDGMYRHVRFQKPGTWCYGFDLVTWPGYLAIVGDAGDYMFARIRDMFDFFASDNGRINPYYWSEKLQAPGMDGVQRFSESVFKQRVREWLEDQCSYLDRQERRALTAAVHTQILRKRVDHYEEARALLDDFQADGGLVRVHDAWEWDVTDYTFQFLWCCHAIAWGVGQYRAAKATEGMP